MDGPRLGTEGRMSDLSPSNTDQAASGIAAAQPLDAQTRLLAAMAYGESSLQDNPDEMMAIASVLVRQRDARG